MRVQRVTLPAFILPGLIFAIWLYLVVAYLPVLQSDIGFNRQILAGLFLYLDLVLVITWFLAGSIAFAVLAAASCVMQAYLILSLEDKALWIQVFTVVAIYIWLFRLREMVERDRLFYLVENEKTQGKVNLAREEFRHKELVIHAQNRRLNRLEDLRLFSDRLKGLTELGDALEVVEQELERFFPQADQLLVYLIDEKNQSLGLVHQASPKGIRTLSKMGDEHDHWVLKRSQAILVEDADKDFRFLTERPGEAAYRSFAIMPLVAERKVFGVIRLNAVEPGKFSSEDLRLLDIISNLCMVSLRSILLYQKTRELAIRDSLTECFLNRYVQERINEEVYRALRQKSVFSIIMADIDHFKKFNDEFGHAAGDLILKEIAQILKSGVSEPDIVGRYGGEEFCLVLPGKNTGESFKLAEALRSKVAGHNFLLRRERLPITLSLGIATFGRDGATREEVLWKADQNLYEAKKRGRNQSYATPAQP